jgi:hypothetical protein
VLDQAAAVAGAEDAPVRAGGAGRAERGSGRERREVGGGAVAVEEAEQRRRAVEPAEAGAGDEAAPVLADEGGAGEEGGVVRREAGEDLLDEVATWDGEDCYGRTPAGGAARFWAIWGDEELKRDTERGGDLLVTW